MHIIKLHVYHSFPRLLSLDMDSNFEIRKVQGLIGETSFSIVLPKVYATRLGIEKGNFVKVRQEGSSLIIEKA
jgi:hypothetical protein